MSSLMTLLQIPGLLLVFGAAVVPFLPHKLR